MKIKLFYQKNNQAYEDFENQVNGFIATVKVIDIKYTETTYGDSDGLYTSPSIMVVYEF